MNSAKLVGGLFCFSSFVCAFFFERVPTLRPHVVVRDGGPWESRMRQWCEMMIYEGGGIVGFFFTHELLDQWKKILIAVEDYPYAYMDYTGDAGMPHPPS